MKRASYRDGVAWIAAHDESTEENPEAVSAANTTRLLAKLFGRDEKMIAFDVLKQRRSITINAERSQDDFDFDDDESAIDRE